MAFGAAKSAMFQIDLQPGGTVLADVSGYLTSVEVSIDGNTIDTTTLGDTWHDFIRGQNDATVKIEGIYDPYMGTLLYKMGTATASSSFVYSPQGTASGKLRLSGELFLTSFSEPSSLDEAVTFTADFQNTGALTTATS